MSFSARFAASANYATTPCASLEEQMRRLAEQYEQEQKAYNNLASILGEHIEHVGKLTANYKALTDDLTELFR